MIFPLLGDFSFVQVGVIDAEDEFDESLIDATFVNAGASYDGLGRQFTSSIAYAGGSTDSYGATVFDVQTSY
ncbi:MAG: hypothetical protein AAF198_08835 [Pseudomonadota bacterium]